MDFILGKSKSLHFYDFGPNGNYREPPKALRVLWRMPAGAFAPPRNADTPYFRAEYQNLKKPLKKSNAPKKHQLQKPPHPIPIRISVKVHGTRFAQKSRVALKAQAIRKQC